MKLDSVIIRVLTKIGQKHGVKTERAYDIVHAYYSAIKHVGITSDKATLIGIENLGKLIYNERSEKAAKIHMDNYQLLKKKNEANSAESSN